MTEQQKKHIEETLLSHDAILPAETKAALDNSYAAIVDYLTTNKDMPKQSEADATKLYGEFLELAKAHGEAKMATLFKFTLTLEEFKFIKNTITRKMKYNRQDVLIAMRAKRQFLDVFEFTPTKDTQAIETFMVGHEPLTLVSYIIGKYEHEGLDRTAENFAAVVEKMNNISAVYEYIDNRFAEVLERGQNWIAGISPETPATPVAAE
jgi:hypothetical protein